VSQDETHETTCVCGRSLLKETTHSRRGMEAAVERAVRPLLLLLILLITFVLPPMWLRRHTAIEFAPMLRVMLACVLFYVFALIVIYPRLP
jgi:hypothetical protein